MSKDHKKLSINFTAQQYQEISDASKKEDLSMTDWIIKKLPITKEKKLEIKLIEEKIKERISKNLKNRFSVPDLFEEDWKSFTKGSRLVVSKNFYNKVVNNEIKEVEFVEKKSSNLAIYKIK